MASFSVIVGTMASLDTRTPTCACGIFSSLLVPGIFRNSFFFRLGVRVGGGSGPPGFWTRCFFVLRSLETLSFGLDFPLLGPRAGPALFLEELAGLEVGFPLLGRRAGPAFLLGALVGLPLELPFLLGLLVTARLLLPELNLNLLRDGLLVTPLAGQRPPEPPPGLLVTPLAGHRPRPPGRCVGCPPTPGCPVAAALAWFRSFNQPVGWLARFCKSLFTLFGGSSIPLTCCTEESVCFAVGGGLVVAAFFFCQSGSTFHISKTED